MPKKLSIEALRAYLDAQVEIYNCPEFIEKDPIIIPHAYSRKEDIEISALMAATLAWGQRTTIIAKCRSFFAMMDNQPYDFIMNHSENDLKPFEQFKHRTFNATDALYYIYFLKYVYNRYKSLEELFSTGVAASENIGSGLQRFRDEFTSLEVFPHRSGKHVSSPDSKSACKRLCMYLRWMARKDNRGVDFGIWHSIDPSKLVCPCDVHVDRVARRLSLIMRKQLDWQTALELTNNLKKLDPADPVKYDFALFGLGLSEKAGLL
ncbi:MAG: TIGR02757 family protein [Cyclobacteriaceae bacterium]